MITYPTTEHYIDLAPNSPDHQDSRVPEAEASDNACSPSRNRSGSVPRLSRAGAAAHCPAARPDYQDRPLICVPPSNFGGIQRSPWSPDFEKFAEVLGRQMLHFLKNHTYTSFQPQPACHKQTPTTTCSLKLRCCPRGLSGHGQSESPRDSGRKPRIHNHPRIRSLRASFNKVAKARGHIKLAPWWVTAHAWSDCVKRILRNTAL